MNEQTAITRLAGTTLGIYHIEQIVEQDTFGAIFLASVQPANMLSRLHALFLSPTMTPEARIVFLGQYQQQAHELIELLAGHEKTPKHPHLLPFIDSGNAQDVLYLISPHTPMRSLTSLLKEQQAIDVMTIGLYLDQMASALEYAHHHTLIHRNLNTDVVFIRADGRLVIADLGIMRLLELSHQDIAPALLYTYSPSANPAPEQLVGQPAHTYTDVYALGAILYRLLTGHRVFSATSPQASAEQHLQAPVPSLAKWRQISVGQRDVTMALDNLIAAAMAKDPQKRLQHPAELANGYYQIVAPNDTTRQPIASPLASAIATPALASTPPTLLRSTRGQNTPGGRRAVQQPDTHRRALILAGGAIVAVGGIAFIAEQFINKTGTTTVIGSTANTTSSTSSGSTQSVPTTNSSASGATHSGNVIAQQSAIAVNSAITFKNPNPNAFHPGVLVHLPSGQFAAFDSTCTHHASCSVSYVPQDKLLECPCHGAEFDPAKQAAVVQGPAQTPLAPIQIKVNTDGTITTV